MGGVKIKIKVHLRPAEAKIGAELGMNVYKVDSSLKLIAHLRYVFECKDCDQAFKTSYSVKKHLRVKSLGLLSSPSKDPQLSDT